MHSMAAQSEKPITIEPPILVYNSKSLGQMLSHLARQTLIAIDTESDSYFAYQPKVCLIQISVYADPAVEDPMQVADYLVDPLRLRDLSRLGILLAQPQIEVVMHAADNDILQLQRDFGFRFSKLFDTQLAARILGWRNVGLAPLLEEHFGVISDKRMQRTDWSVRPLTPQQIAYAQMDTHYLFALRSLQLEHLAASDRLEEAQNGFSQLARLAASARTANSRSFWQMKITRSVDRSLTGVLEALWEWREQEAQRLNRPPFRVMGDETLAALASRQPATLQELSAIQGMTPHQVNRYGQAVLAAIQDGKRRPLPDLPAATIRPEMLLDKSQYACYERLRRWRTETAQRRGVAPEIVFNNDTLLQIAQVAPRSEADLGSIEDVGSWKAKTYGASVLALLGDR
jgi:ribonuclease D